MDAEERKFQLGASTLFVVIQQQNTLASSRQNLVNAQLLTVVAPSPEEQRLTELYRKKGIAALAAELSRF
mgnify:CR=1 FL=1